MSVSRRDLLRIAPALAAAGRLPGQSAELTPGRIRLAVSTYSYWHFRTEKYPVERVIDDAARLGFDGVEILHRQMADEPSAYLNRLKQAAFRHGLLGSGLYKPHPSVVVSKVPLSRAVGFSL